MNVNFFYHQELNSYKYYTINSILVYIFINKKYTLIFVNVNSRVKYGHVYVITDVGWHKLTSLPQTI